MTNCVSLILGPANARGGRLKIRVYRCDRPLLLACQHGPGGRTCTSRIPGRYLSAAAKGLREGLLMPRGYIYVQFFFKSTPSLTYPLPAHINRIHAFSLHADTEISSAKIPSTINHEDDRRRPSSGKRLL